MNDLESLNAGQTREYSRLVKAVSNAIDRADPLGLLKSGAPLDEYTSEIGTIVPRLKGANSVDDVQQAIHEEFLCWFGESAGDIQQYRQPALEVWEAVQRFRKAAG